MLYSLGSPSSNEHCSIFHSPGVIVLRNSACPCPVPTTSPTCHHHPPALNTENECSKWYSLKNNVWGKWTSEAWLFLFNTWRNWDSKRFGGSSKAAEVVAEKRELSDSQTQVLHTRQPFLKIVEVTFNWWADLGWSRVCHQLQSDVIVSNFAKPLNEPKVWQGQKGPSQFC